MAFPDGATLDAEVVGDDPDTDVAVLRVASSTLPVPDLGDSDVLRVGELVIAIGNPLGLQATVTSGIVGALGRSLRGQIIGMNTAIIQQAQGICFAVPINTAKWVSAAPIKQGYVSRGYLGIAVQTVQMRATPGQGPSQETTHGHDSGVLISGVAPGSPAQQAGLAEWDIVIQLNGKPTPTIDQVHQMLTGESVGKEMSFVALRRGQRVEGVGDPNGRTAAALAPASSDAA